jgi:hypothetical protein
MAGGKLKTVSRPPVTEWTPEAELLAKAVDKLSLLAAILIRANSRDHKGPDPKSLPRPRTAIHRVERRAFETRYQGWISKLIPGKG